MRSRLPYRQPTGLYVHSSPPTGVPVHDSVVRQWLRGGEITRLKELVLEGDGATLVGEYSPDVTARGFLRALPRILNRIEEAHLAAASKDVERLERTIKRERSARIELSKDHSGLSLLHKAVIHGHHDLQDWLLANYPDLVHLTDRERRSALHYAGSSPDSEEVWKRLTNAGADPTLTDISGNTPAYYMMHPRRARPPQPRGSTVRADLGLVIKPANIRIWIHDRDLGRLQKVVWEGYGTRLLKETSSQPTVRRFLNAVPYILGSIRDVHKAAIENDVETLKKRTEDPVPKDILLSKDSNGLNPLHKAAGLGQKEAVEEILKKAPESANAQDSFGRTPLHYAAALRDPQMYDTLVEGGAIDHLQDKKGNTPSHYRSKPGDLEGSKLLSVVPEAPRTAHIFPPSWDWRLLHSAGPQIKPEVSTETILQDSTPEDITDSTQETEEISRDEAVEESRPEVSEDEGVGSENAQSVDDAASPQISENIDMENVAVDKLDQTITLTGPVFLNELQVGADEEESNESQVETQPGVLDDSSGVEFDEPEVQSDEDTAELGKPPDVESDNDKNNIEPIFQKEETADFYVENSVETVSETSEQMNYNVNIDNINKEVSEAIAFLNEASDKTEDVQNNQKANSKNNTPVQSGRQSLKSRVQKIMRLGRSQGSLEGEFRSVSATSNNEKVEDAVLSQIKNSPNYTETGANQNILRDNESEINITNTKLVEDTTNYVEAAEETCNTNCSEDTKDNISFSVDQDVSDLIATRPDSDQKESQFSEDSLTIVKQNSEEEPTVTENNSEIFEEAQLEDSHKQSSIEKEVEDDSLRVLEHEKEENTTAEETPENVEDLENNSNESTENNFTLLSGIKRSEAERLVAAGDMDAMAEMVLAGEGEALLELTSDNPDVQLFINNVPQYMLNYALKKGAMAVQQTILDAQELAVESHDVEYKRNLGAGLRESLPATCHRMLIYDGQGSMEQGQWQTFSDKRFPIGQLYSGTAELTSSPAKIERVHKSSREGDLRGVRTSLDRRKYAVARDNATSLKPTPLHVAVLFGRTSVLRYLAGRFPETMHAQDTAGRTPLHYAATLPDNGHFYSLLITLGADKAIVDNDGNTAEYYLKNNEGLTREMLLAEYQDRAEPIDTSGLNFNRYSDKVEDDTVSARHDVDEEGLLDQMERCFKLLSTRALGSVLGRILDRNLFEDLHLIYTKLDNTLLDIIRPMGKDLAMDKNKIMTDPNFTGITIPDQESFTLFRKLIEPLIKEISGGIEFNNGSRDYFGNEDQNFFNIDLDPGGIIVKSCVVEVVRNLAPLSFVKNLKLSELEKVEVALSTVLTGYYRKNKDAGFVDEAGENHGSYYTLGEILENKEIYQDLKEEGLVINGVEEGNWPYGRGVFISPFGDITAWMNIREHIQLLSVTPAEKRGHIGMAYKNAFGIIQSLEQKVECSRDPKLGLLATEPGFVGNCLRIHVVLSLPIIGEDLPTLKKLCSSRNLLVEENSRPGIFKLRNKSCQNSNEINLFKSYILSIKDIVEMERASMRVTVTQIPNLIKNFIRKQSSKDKLK